MSIVIANTEKKTLLQLQVATLNGYYFGLYVSNTQGQNQQKIASVTGESLRWEGN